MPKIGAGVYEIRFRIETGAYRLVYIAKLMAAVYVLHCFQKKTQKTSAADIELGSRRLRELLKEAAQ